MRTKICGITRLQDARVAVEAGADAIGLVFYPPSPRDISENLSLAAEITREVGPFVTVVGLVVNPDAEHLNRILGKVPLHTLQFHGDETEAFCLQFNRSYIKAVRMKQGINVNQQIAAYPSASGILLDAYKKGTPGGTGESFDWGRVPLNAKKPIVLAGGLNPGNVTTAVRITEAYAVDVSGGVEQSPGVKSASKVRAFVEHAVMEN
ncbi:MAG: phosphoribosylanthranilate isomerase [Cellvibrionaceae bacterium]|nr:phosphoribosylanthranilate isomerase [Cellvibrionaceae bacterium]